MSAPGFVHLHLHSEYSLADSVVRIPQLLAAVRAAGMPAVAITDLSNLFALVGFYKAAVSAGIKPIVGADLWLRRGVEGSAPARLTLLCRNGEGYRNLSRLISRAYLEGQQAGMPLLERQWLEDGAVRGLIALSGGREGVLGAAIGAARMEEARVILDEFRGLFGGDFYLELVRTGRSGEEQHIAGAVRLAAEAACPVVATNDVRFIAPADFEAHEARVCIHQGRTLDDASRPHDYSEQQYLRSAEEMAGLFADLPEALENSVEIARRCTLELELGAVHLPELAVPDGLSVDEFLLQQARAGLARLVAAGLAPADAVYDQRLEEEAKVICRMGFSGYFLIVADFIRWSRAHDIPVGPGRGSGAGSLVAWALGITELDPIRHSLLFERFLNPERVSMPDFDIDFCMEGRDRVIDYVTEHYGRERVSQIITFGTMAARAVVRDVGRVLGHPYGFTEKIAKLIPPEPKIWLDDAIEGESELRALIESDDDVRSVIDLARQLEGLVRNAGRHAGGVVIAPTRITDFAPLYCVQGDSTTVTQFDKDGLEAVGLVKFDFLGLRTLTIIDLAVKTINGARSGSGEAPLDIALLPLDDAATYELLRSGRTTAVFQLESSGMRDLIKKLKPDHFDDLVALVALYRPGPLQSGMVEDFISRKHAGSGSSIDYLHPDLEPVLRSTYGVIVYQEQVMQIAQVLAGYTLGGADLLRRAMGKKKPEEMAKQRSVFLQGAAARGVSAALATRIFDLMEKFAEYGFNRSHSAAYAVLSYQTAWLKTHHPASFMAAVLTCEMDDTDKLTVLKRECESLGLLIEPPDVNRSAHVFAVSGPRSIRYGLGAIKGLGVAAAGHICAVRDSAGPYASLHDFCRRAGGQRLGRRAMEALIKAGALDGLGPNRASLMAALAGALAGAEQAARTRDAGQQDMFGVTAAAEFHDETVATVEEWSFSQRLAAEREGLGLYLSGHPFDQYRADAAHIAPGSLAAHAGMAPPPPGMEFQSSVDVVVAGLISSLRKRAGRIMLELDDGTGLLEASLFPETFERCRACLNTQAIVVVSGQLRWEAFINGWRLAARDVMDIDSVLAGRASRLLIRWDAGGGTGPRATELRSALEPFRPGNCAVSVYYTSTDAEARLDLAPEWSVRPDRELRERLTRLVGIGGFRFVYDTTRSMS